MRAIANGGMTDRVYVCVVVAAIYYMFFVSE